MYKRSGNNRRNRHRQRWECIACLWERQQDGAVVAASVEVAEHQLFKMLARQQEERRRRQQVDAAAEAAVDVDEALAVYRPGNMQTVRLYRERPGADAARDDAARSARCAEWLG